MKKKGFIVLSGLLITSLITSSMGLASSSQVASHHYGLNYEEIRVSYEHEEDALSLQSNDLDLEASEEGAKSFLEQNQHILGLNDPQADLQLKDIQTDELGMTHVRFQQLKEELPVHGFEVTVHFDEENVVQKVNGHVARHADELELDTTANITDEEARKIAKQAIGAPKVLEYEPTAEKMIYTMGEEVYVAYEVNVNFLSENPGNWVVYVDAHSGEVVDKHNKISHIAAGTGLEPEMEQASANAEQPEQYTYRTESVASNGMNGEDYRSATGSGYGVHGEQRVFNISHRQEDEGGRTFKLYDLSRPDLDGILTYEHQDGMGLPGVPYRNGNASFKDDDGAAVDAHYNSAEVYEYFLEEHGRNSIDDEGMALVSTVHYGDNFNNAFWNGSQMTYGDGDGEFFIPLSAGLDVAAHEIAHGVTEHTAGLVYQFQPGAVNEAISDIFGVLVDDSSWDVGDDVMAPAAIEDGRTALRSLEDPGKFQVDEAYWEYGDGSGRYPSHMDEYYDLPINLDNGGVHTNSSIINHAAYLIGDEVGREKLGQVVYRALTVYLAPMSDFSDTRDAFIQSAADIYGEDTEVYTATVDAFDSVGIYE